jgi:transketolase
MNGISAYGANLIPCGGTFLNFVSYAAGAVRLSALGRHRVIWIATHDSVEHCNILLFSSILLTPL